MENRINQVVELENGKKYLILKQAIYKGQNYYFVVETNEGETEVLEQTMLLQEIKDEDGIRLEKITDAKTYKLIARYLNLMEK